MCGQIVELVLDRALLRTLALALPALAVAFYGLFVGRGAHELALAMPDPLASAPRSRLSARKRTTELRLVAHSAFAIGLSALELRARAPDALILALDASRFITHERCETRLRLLTFALRLFARAQCSGELSLGLLALALAHSVGGRQRIRALFLDHVRVSGASR